MRGLWGMRPWMLGGQDMRRDFALGVCVVSAQVSCFGSVGTDRRVGMMHVGTASASLVSGQLPRASVWYACQLSRALLSQRALLAVVSWLVGSPIWHGLRVCFVKGWSSRGHDQPKLKPPRVRPPQTVHLAVASAASPPVLHRPAHILHVGRRHGDDIEFGQ